MIKLGIGIPYYNGHKKSRELYELLKNNLQQQWKSFYYKDDKVTVVTYNDFEGEGVSYTRNKLLEGFIFRGCTHVVFIDADDNVDENFIDELYNACKYAKRDGFNVIECEFYIRNRLVEPKEGNLLPVHVTGMCYDTELIKDMRFDERYLIGEDEKWSKELNDSGKVKKMLCAAKYYYNFGINNDCLSYKYQRNEIPFDRVYRGDNM